MGWRWYSAEALERVSNMASEADRKATEALSEYKGHERLCTERWTEAKTKMEEVHHSVAGINKTIRSGLTWVVVILCSTLLSLLAWIASHFLTFTAH